MNPTPRSLIAGLGGVAALVLAANLGCQVFDKPPEDALNQFLTPVTTSPDSVTLEIFHARIPLDKEGTADAIWAQIDEQRFDVELRDQLMANGLRAGVVGASPPEAITDLLALQSDAPESSAVRVIDGKSAVPRVTRQVKQLNRRDEMAIQVSEVREEVDVLLPGDAGRMGGKTFKQAQGVYTLQAEAVPGQRVKVRLTPELQHGELRNRCVGSDQGIFLSTVSREREVFEELTMQTELAPGDLLILGCLPDAKSSLGGVFHTAAAGGQEERKLIVLRLLEVPPSEILAGK
ncbi:MAG TPA: hypothetical protein VF175_05055 [Lacipirellula sp.]